MRLLCIFTVLSVTAYAAQKRYDGYQVLEVVPQTTTQLRNLRLIAMKQIEWDFWLKPSHLHKPVHVLLSPQNSDIFKRQMERQELPVTVIRDNVQTELDAFKSARANIPEQFDYDYNEYNTLEDYMTELSNLAANSCPSGKTCTIETIGTSTEGRNIDAMTIVDDTDDKEWFWMDSCVHAREWLACATLMNIVNRMMTDESARPQLDAYNWVIIPMMNPDGYSFSWTDDRYWRKSRNINEGSDCIGTDINSNFDYQWNRGGSTPNPCSLAYHGTSPASEPETQAIQNYAQGLSDPIVGWLSFQTYGEYWLEPYGNCTDDPRWADDVSDVGDATCAAIEATFETAWDCGNSCRVQYGTSGSVSDWAMGAMGVKYSYTPHLRGEGFDAPASEIQPAYEETWNGFVAKLDAINSIEESRK